MVVVVMTMEISMENCIGDGAPSSKKFEIDIDLLGG